jgi:hypothetical protein
MRSGKAFAALALLLGSLGLAAAGLAPSSAAAQGAATPVVQHTVRFSRVHANLTDGPKVLVLHVTGSSSRTLDLVNVSLVGETSHDGSQVWLSTRSAGYWFGYQPVRKLSGDDTSGTWRVRIPLHRHLPQGRYDVTLTWKVGQTEVGQTLRRTVTLTNQHSDVHAPTLVSLKQPKAGARISRTSKPEVRVHLRDTGSGVGVVWICYEEASRVDPLQCDEADRVSGTKNDGVWAGRLTHLRKLQDGDTVIRVTADDRDTLDAEWAPADQPGYRVIPHGRGHVMLVG